MQTTHPASDQLFPEAALQKLIGQFKGDLKANRVDLYMTYDHGDSYCSIVTSSTERGYAAKHKTNFSIKKSQWGDEDLVLDLIAKENPTELSEGINETVVFVSGWFIEYPKDRASREQIDEPIRQGPVAIVRISGSQSEHFGKKARDRIARQIASALWLSRSKRILASNLLLQHIGLHGHPEQFTSLALRGLYKYIRAEAVFSFQRDGDEYRVAMIVATKGEANSLKGAVVPKQSVFHPNNRNVDVGNVTPTCDFDRAIMPQGRMLFEVSSCEVQATDSLVKLNVRDVASPVDYVPILHICAVGKREFDFEYQFFSDTDKAILAQVSNAIAAHLNTSKLAIGYRQINELINKARPNESIGEHLEGVVIGKDLQDKIEIQIINEGIEGVIQNVGNFFIVWVSGGRGSVEFLEGDRTYFDEGTLISSIERSTCFYNTRSGYVNCVQMYCDEGGRSYYFCYHTVARQISRYKGELISFLINEFRVNFQEHLELERRFNLMAQFQHATKGPLAAVVSALTMLRNRAQIYASNPNMLARLSRTSAHQSAMTDSLLWIEKSRQLGEFAQILVEGYGPDKVIWSDTNVVEIVKASVELFKGYAKSREKNIKVEIDERMLLQVVSCHTRAVEVVVHNLIDNAIKYGHRGRTVLVRVERLDRDNDWIFSVSDYGEPIPDVDSSAIYEVFRRSSDPRVTRRRSGMGLGLAICKEILDAHYEHNGLCYHQDHLDSSGRSAEVTFSFRLPLVGKGEVRKGNNESYSG